ncbi:hypothetical protein ACFE04_023098 [Oxalis oulophora]
MLFSDGWSAFVKDNKLKVDDTCVFELDNTGNKSVWKSPFFGPMKLKIIASGQNYAVLTIVGKKANRKMKMLVPETEGEDVDHIEPANKLQFERRITSNLMKYQIWLPQEFALETGLNSKQKERLK